MNVENNPISCIIFRKRSTQIRDPKVKFETPFGPPELGAENGSQI